MAVSTLKVKGQKTKLAKSSNFSMTIGRTFKFPQFMHINVGNKNMHNNYHFVTSLRVKDKMNESQQIFVQLKVFEPLMLETSNSQG